ncbi:PREDICTED: up-regulated during skeletal muscle growth protein 5-like [Priapulus caudatus]|uniref:Up-regulated during skeletal muscle growth protein 5-like n=1 Tax=Priapulus caudatus TaxID=37621 RepID=A0ABM1E6L9_PRICU|nr:PREDICTED: up-regulated during skeletal muscle growth protein 5-like [Priapulus caudatus]
MSIALRPRQISFNKCDFTVTRMAGHSAVDEAKFTGLARYFNGETRRGRANVAGATYAGIALVAAYFMMRKKPSKMDAVPPATK